MKAISFFVLGVGMLIGSSGSAQEGLTPEPDRITDEAIASDRKVMDDLYERLKRLNDGGTPASGYHFSKAQAWLDFAREEYVENDRTGVIEAALWQSESLIGALEAKGTQMSMETPILTSSTRVREDLWRRADALKKQAYFHCAEDKVAQMEVQLVWAGHEEPELGWRHALPHIRTAERLEKEATRQMEACVTPVVAPLPPPPPAASISEMLALADRVHFALDQSTLHASTLPILDRIASILRSHPTINLHLTGHADRRGTEGYNVRLSDRRAKAVRRYLMSTGVDGTRLTTEAAGRREAADADATALSFARSRRVAFQFSDTREIAPAPQETDLQQESEVR
jgi:outer membrane protein OmpA-like peptidoglycan-associated protein